MTSFKQESMTRREFCKDVTCMAFCCAGLASAVRTGSVSAAGGKEHLAAACGTWCGACPAYLAKHGQRTPEKRASVTAKAQKGVPDPKWMDGLLCDGCLSGGQLAAHCEHCQIRLCSKRTQKDARCTECPELPCHRITGLIRMGEYLHRGEYLPNLKKMREMGVKDWARIEEQRWRCPRCGAPMSWYDVKCVGCGDPRPRAVFPLPSQPDPS